MPEFVSGIVLILIFSVWLGWLPVSATAPPGSGFFTSLKYLILPVIPLVLILFGYIARMARVGTIEALGSDYARTATLKGLPRGVMIRRHVLRNSLLPTITVVATQTGYLIGGLVVVEFLFRYQGIGLLTYNAANQKDFPMLEACVLTIGVIYMLVTLIADISFSLLNPRIRLKARRMSAIADVEIESAGALHADRQVARRELISELLHSPAFLVGAFILLVWIICAIFGTAIAPHSPYAQNLLGINKAPSSAHPFGTDQLGRDMLSRVIVGSRDILVIAPLATLLGTVLGTAVGLVMGYYRGIVDDVLGRVVEAFLALPLIVTAVIAIAALGTSNATLIIVIGHRVHAADRAHRARSGAAGATTSTTSPPPACAARGRCTSCSSRSFRTCSRRSSSSSPYASPMRSSRC